MNHFSPDNKVIRATKNDTAFCLITSMIALPVLTTWCQFKYKSYVTLVFT